MQDKEFRTAGHIAVGLQVPVSSVLLGFGALGVQPGLILNDTAYYSYADFKRLVHYLDDAGQLPHFPKVQG
jgi:hypothetical protein